MLRQVGRRAHRGKYFHLQKTWGTLSLDVPAPHPAVLRPPELAGNLAGTLIRVFEGSVGPLLRLYIKQSGSFLHLYHSS